MQESKMLEQRLIELENKIENKIDNLNASINESYKELAKEIAEYSKNSSLDVQKVSTSTALLNERIVNNTSDLNRLGSKVSSIQSDYVSKKAVYAICTLIPILMQVIIKVLKL